MRVFNVAIVAAAFAVFSTACNCGGTKIGQGNGGGTGQGGQGGGTQQGTGGNGGNGSVGGGAGNTPDPNNLNNDKLDSDCDGLSDAEEFGNIYPGGNRTNPGNADTDGDGIKDGVEVGRTTSVNGTCGFVGDADAATRTNPTSKDSDGDGIGDGVEDKNKSGKVDTGETDPTNPDSDLDGLWDGVEDANHNGTREPTETDPTKSDTDQDFINDGIEVAVTKTDPLKADTDGDTCVDGKEDFNRNGVVDTLEGETDPKDPNDCGPVVNPDSDADGLPDKIEDKNNNMMVDPGETDPNKKDTDGDGLMDGIEDANRNGVFENGETNPLRPDTDCDGLLDGPDYGTVRGEDLNADGIVQANETDPRRRDTDGDGISDGVETGRTINLDPTNCPSVPFDADNNTLTNPTQRDSDGDGIDDGAEDLNQNGKVDPGELNPNDRTDGEGPAGKVCTVMNLRPVRFQQEQLPDVQLGLPASFTDVRQMVVAGEVKGLIGHDPTNQVVFVAWRQAAPMGATNATEDEAALVSVLNGVGTISSPVTQAFTTWDGVGARTATYTMAGGVDLKARANAIANAVVGAGAGALSGNAGISGPFSVQAEYVHRSDTSVVVVLALKAATGGPAGAIFSMRDTGGGSALAQFGDANAAQCETFAPIGGVVDFLFVVDDSCSMGSEQDSLAAAATAMASSLNNSTLDWRAALVTSSYHSANRPWSTNSYRRSFTNNLATFQSWLNVPLNGSGQPVCDVSAENGNAAGCGAVAGGWVGINGNGNEGLLGAARKAIMDIQDNATPVADRKRAAAQLVVVLLGDADDQTTGLNSTSTGDPDTAKCTYGTSSSAPAALDNCEAIANFTNFFRNTNGVSNGTGGNIPVHGIVCPSSGTYARRDTNPNRYGYRNCGEDQALPQRHAQVMNATTGIRGDISTPSGITATMDAIVSSTISAAGYQMLKPPIGASVKVALNSVRDANACNKDDLPRSRQDGFDFDGINRTISFFGACRPAGQNPIGAVSYKYWINVTPNPNGNPAPCASDPFFDSKDPDFCKGKLVCDIPNNTCECPANCGGVAPPGQTCNTNRAVCDFVCTADCGGTCTGFQQCNVSSCACECVQTATCAAGFKFQNGAGVCGCVCDTATLGCGNSYNADPNTCSCVCKPDCGGCGQGLICNPSTCSCGVGSPG